MIETVTSDPIFEFDIVRVDAARWLDIGQPGTRAVRQTWKTQSPRLAELQADQPPAPPPRPLRSILTRADQPFPQRGSDHVSLPSPAPERRIRRSQPLTASVTCRDMLAAPVPI